jgi:hypothetical protein
MQLRCVTVISILVALHILPVRTFLSHLRKMKGAILGRITRRRPTHTVVEKKTSSSSVHYFIFFYWAKYAPHTGGFLHCGNTNGLFQTLLRAAGRQPVSFVDSRWFPTDQQFTETTMWCLMPRTKTHPCQTFVCTLLFGLCTLRLYYAASAQSQRHSQQ